MRFPVCKIISKLLFYTLFFYNTPQQSVNNPWEISLHQKYIFRIGIPLYNEKQLPANVEKFGKFRKSGQLLTQILTNAARENKMNLELIQGLPEMFENMTGAFS